MEQEGSRCLRALTPRDGSLETVEQAHAAFEDFFLQAAVRSETEEQHPSRGRGAEGAARQDRTAEVGKCEEASRDSEEASANHKWFCLDGVSSRKPSRTPKSTDDQSQNL